MNEITGAFLGGGIAIVIVTVVWAIYERWGR